MTAVASLRSVPTSGASQLLLERTALLAWNAAEKGDSDVLPWCAEFRILRAFAEELSQAAWADDCTRAIETVQAPLSKLTSRNVHLLHPISFLRFGGAVLALADQVEAQRVPATVATAVRWAPNRSRGRIILPGSFQRWETALGDIEGKCAMVLELDLAAFFPSVRFESFVKLLPEPETLLQEHRRLGILGLPVGGIPARILGELLLDAVDRCLIDAGRLHVRRMDDMAIGVGDEKDAAEVIKIVSGATEKLGLTINKSKTKLRPSKWKVEELDPVEEGRRLLGQHDPDRVKLVRALRDIRDLVSAWDGRKRSRWIRLLADAACRVSVGLSSLLRTVEALLPGSGGLDAHVQKFQAVLGAPVPLHRAESARFLSRQRIPVVPDLVRLVVADPSPLVRREALLGLVRLGARDEVRGLLRGDPPGELDHGAWIVAAGVFGIKRDRCPDPYGALLYQAAREHLPRDI